MMFGATPIQELSYFSFMPAAPRQASIFFEVIVGHTLAFPAEPSPFLLLLLLPSSPFSPRPELSISLFSIRLYRRSEAPQRQAEATSAPQRVEFPRHFAKSKIPVLHPTFHFWHFTGWFHHSKFALFALLTITGRDFGIDVI
jgi:hypothetical protein